MTKTPEPENQNWYDDDKLYEWDAHELKEYQKFKRRARMGGLLIILITCIWTLTMIINAIHSLFTK